MTNIRLRHYSIRTERAYRDWVARFLHFHDHVEQVELIGENEVADFLAHLTLELKVSASTQSQALNALAFFFKYVMKAPLSEMNFARAKRPKRLPVVLSRSEVQALLVGQ